MVCIGEKDNYRVYYDRKHNEYLLMTPNYRFIRCFSRCANIEIAEWAKSCKEKHSSIDTVDNKLDKEEIV